MSTKLKVLVAEESRLLREALCQALVLHGFDVVGEVEDAWVAMTLALERRPDVCLLDLEMPGGALRAAGEIRLRVPRCAVLLRADKYTDEDILAALRVGIWGCLSKDMDLSRLSHTIYGILDGECAIPRRQIRTLVEQVRASLARDHLGDAGDVNLTSREWQVLELLADGLSTVEIAECLYISRVTVRTHVSSLLRKLGVADREAAVRLYQGC